MSRPPKQHDEQELRKRIASLESNIADLNRLMNILRENNGSLEEYLRMQERRDELQSQVEYYRWLILSQPKYR